jgi:endonuclease VIII
VPEGDTLARIAHVLNAALVGQRVSGARGRPGGAALERVVGHVVEDVVARGKHLLIGFSGGLTLHTHLGMHGSWHRYRPGERWRRSPSRAVAVLETPAVVCVCFDAPTVELLDTRALAIHPQLSRLGPELLDPGFDVEEALSRLREPRLGAATLGAGLVDQRAAAGLGNVYRSELCFLEGVHPARPLAEVDDETLRRLLRRGAALLAANAHGGRRVTTAPGTPGATYVYGRAGRPCRRCRALVASAVSGDPPRRVYWCPGCQPAAPGTSEARRAGGGAGGAGPSPPLASAKPAAMAGSTARGRRPR